MPAIYLARFSMETSTPRRDRRIAVGDKHTQRCFETSAAKVGARHDFYTLVDSPGYPNMVDDIWSKYESGLDVALEELIKGTIDADTWARVLAPFVACLLLRGPDFNERFYARIKSLEVSEEYIARDTINAGRMLELQRLLGPVVAAKWIIAEKQGAGSIITNDVGFTAFAHFYVEEYGLAIPIGQSHVLLLVPQRERTVVMAKGEKWFPIIEYIELSENSHIELNKTLVLGAQRFIFGQDKASIQKYLIQENSPAQTPEPWQLGFISGTLAAVHEFTWHRLVGVLAKSPLCAESYNFDLDWKAIASGWHPPVILPTNLPEFPSPLIREGNSIKVHFYDVEGFTT